MRFWLIAIFKSIPKRWLIVLSPFVFLFVVFISWFFFCGLFIEPPDPRFVRHQEELARILPKAELGNRRAQYRAGVILRDGLAGKKSPRSAVRWFEKAAKSGSLNAIYALGRANSKGEGMPQNFGRAAELYRTAAGLGRHLEAQYSLADLYFHGKGVEQDFAKAVSWYKKAALRGHPAAQAIMASMFEKGWGIEKSNVEAYIWYSLAAAQAEKLPVYKTEIDAKTALMALNAKLSRLDLETAQKKLKALRRRTKK